VTVSDDGTLEPFYVSSTFMGLSPQREFFLHSAFQDGSVQPMKSRPGFRPWTDDYSDIVAISVGLPNWVRSFVL
jgi:hypothetical protein